jgi:hypothetical protein
MSRIESYQANSGWLVSILKLEIHTRSDDANRILDAITEVEPLESGRYCRNE